jgi:hypothetical protein
MPFYSVLQRSPCEGGVSVLRAYTSVEVRLKSLRPTALPAFNSAKRNFLPVPYSSFFWGVGYSAISDWISE